MTFSTENIVAYLLRVGCNEKLISIIFGIVSTYLSVLVWFFLESPAVTEKQEIEEGNIQKESVFQKKYMNLLMMGIAMMFFQQFAGCHVIIATIDSLFIDAKIQIEFEYAAPIATISGVIGCLIGGFMMDKFRRKIICIISSFMMGLALVPYEIQAKIHTIPWLSLVSIFLYWHGFEVGVEPLA